MDKDSYKIPSVYFFFFRAFSFLPFPFENTSYGVPFLAPRLLLLRTLRRRSRRAQDVLNPLREGASGGCAVVLAVTATTRRRGFLWCGGCRARMFQTRGRGPSHSRGWRRSVLDMFFGRRFTRFGWCTRDGLDLRWCTGNRTRDFNRAREFVSEGTRVLGLIVSEAGRGRAEGQWVRQRVTAFGGCSDDPLWFGRCGDQPRLLFRSVDFGCFAFPFLHNVGVVAEGNGNG